VGSRELTRAERNIAWIEAYCRVPEGRHVGRPVVMRDWQRAELIKIYDNPHGTRRAILSFGRKNGKTSLSAFLLLLHLCGPEAVANSQLFSAAQSRDQASVLFALAAKVVRQSPDLSQYIVVRDTAKQLFCAELGTLYRALSAEASTAYGLSPAFVVHDELGQVRGPRSELYEALETAAGAQERPLSIIISTQAPTDADLLSILIDDALRGKDVRTVVSLHTADEGLDPFSDEAIRQANPALGDFLNQGEVREQAESARRMPAREASYRNLILNQRVNLTNPFVSRGVWDANRGEPDAEAFADGEVFLGLDLSARSDLTAVVAVVRDAEGFLHVEPVFFAPEVGVVDRAHRDRAPYDVWARDGHLQLTPGASVDYAQVAQWLADYCADRNVAVIRFDRWRIDVLKAELARLGVDLPLEPHGQGFRDMTPALDALEFELVSGKIRHGGHPVLTMCAANAVATRDAAGNRKLDKAKATGRIDGMVALAMAIGAASTQQRGEVFDFDAAIDPIRYAFR
jgi:phage terminase large subunit-like protein